MCGLGGLRWDSWGRMEDALARKMVAYVQADPRAGVRFRYGEEIFSLQSLPEHAIPAMLDDNDIDAHGPGSYSGGFPASVLSLLAGCGTRAHHRAVGATALHQVLAPVATGCWTTCAGSTAASPRGSLCSSSVPLYNTNIGHYREGEAMRTELQRDFCTRRGWTWWWRATCSASERSFPVHRHAHPSRRLWGHPCDSRRRRQHRGGGGHRECLPWCRACTSSSRAAVGNGWSTPQMATGSLLSPRHDFHDVWQRCSSVLWLFRFVEPQPSYSAYRRSPLGMRSLL